MKNCTLEVHSEKTISNCLAFNRANLYFSCVYEGDVLASMFTDLVYQTQKYT